MDSLSLVDSVLLLHALFISCVVFGALLTRSRRVLGNRSRQKVVRPDHIGRSRQLAPEIVEDTVIDGGSNLSFTAVMDRLPANWVEQRRDVEPDGV
jgi:hypothetical protein